MRKSHSVKDIFLQLLIDCIHLKMVFINLRFSFSSTSSSSSSSSSEVALQRSQSSSPAASWRLPRALLHRVSPRRPCGSTPSELRLKFHRSIRSLFPQPLRFPASLQATLAALQRSRGSSLFLMLFSPLKRLSPSLYPSKTRLHTNGCFIFAQRECLFTIAATLNSTLPPEATH